MLTLFHVLDEIGLKSRAFRHRSLAPPRRRARRLGYWLRVCVPRQDVHADRGHKHVVGGHHVRHTETRGLFLRKFAGRQHPRWMPPSCALVENTHERACESIESFDRAVLTTGKE